MLSALFWITLRVSTYQSGSERNRSAATAIGALVELPAMLWVDRLGRRHGSGQLLRMSFLLYAACALSVVIAPTIPVILFSHVIDGVAYSFS